MTCRTSFFADFAKSILSKNISKISSENALQTATMSVLTLCVSLNPIWQEYKVHFRAVEGRIFIGFCRKLPPSCSVLITASPPIHVRNELRLLPGKRRHLFKFDTNQWRHPCRCFWLEITCQRSRHTLTLPLKLLLHSTVIESMKHDQHLEKESDLSSPIHGQVLGCNFRRANILLNSGFQGKTWR